MNKRNILVSVYAALSLTTMAQEGNSIKGVVLDEWGKPVSGAVVIDMANPETKAATGEDGSFTIEAGKQLKVQAPNQSEQVVEVNGNNITVQLGFKDRPVYTGAGKLFTESESTVSVASAWGEDINKRSTKDIGQSLFGQILGLQTLQNSARFAGLTATQYLRGVQSASGSNPIVIVDGIERDITDITPEEVENVTVLKDAAAAALYGYKGANGAIVIMTKRGLYEKKEVKLSYEHAFNWEARRPKFLNGYQYASAVNEARANEGAAPVYNEAALDAFKNGTDIYNYPNVNWIDETLRNISSTDYVNLSFRGGGMKFRYYTLFSLVNSNGFIKNPNLNDGYSTQEKYMKANIRSNWDIDLTPKTKMVVNLLGTLAESNYPGNNVDLWTNIYNTPSGAIPVKTEDGTWGGSSSFPGTLNPVGQATGAAYSKNHRRTLNADLTLTQNLDGFLDGLYGSFRLAYDNTSLLTENRSKVYNYGMGTYKYTVTSEEMATANELSSYNRLFNFYAQLSYDKTFGKHAVYAQGRWEYEHKNSQGLNTTYNRTNLSFLGHYGYESKYLADIVLNYSGSNKLAKGDKWHLSPTFSAAWVLSKENFMQNLSWVNFLKLRLSYGTIYNDVIPYEDYWEQLYQYVGTGYRIGTDFGVGNARYEVARIASQTGLQEHANKFNIGIDATLFNGLDVNMEYFYQRRKNIWVEATGKYTGVLGASVPYEAAEQINSWGFELGLNYTKIINNDWTINAGTNFSWTGSKVVDMLEQPQPFDNLTLTGLRYGQLQGLEAIGLFKDAEDIANSPKQNFGTVYPGDIKYRDVNQDGVIDANDVKAIGYSTTCPEIYYSFKLGAEYKDFGFSALFQGTGRYSAMMSSAMVRPLAATNSISEEYYNNRWTPENLNAKYPRLSYQSNSNNYRNSTFWLVNRAYLKLRYVELYYNLPKSLMEKTKFLSKAKVYVRGTDLLCFDKIDCADPDTYNSLRPTTRSIIAGFSVDF